MMKSAFRCFQMFLLLCGVFGADEVKSVSVMEGDSVTLDADLTQIKRFYLIEWRFGDPIIAQTDGKDISYPNHTEIFRNRLQLDQTGSLTIKNMKTKHSGLYKLQISHSAGTTVRKFSVTVYESASDAGKSEMKSFSLKEGDRVTLQTDVTQLYGDELIVWRFGDEGKLIAKADMEVKSSLLYDSDERFRGRLELDQTGSLIITNTRTTDSGLYAVKISSKKQTSYQKYVVTISGEAGLSSVAVAGIVVLLLFLAAAAAAGVIYYRRKISELRKQTLRVTVNEGEDVPLKPNKEINKDDVILWLYGDAEQLTHIAEIRTKPRRIVTHDNAADGIFRGRLYLDETTGSLTIKNSRTAHSGPYTLHITSSSGDPQQIFFVTVNKRVEVNPVIKEGGSVTLNPDTEIQRDDLILWTFGHQDDLIAQRVRGGTVEICDDGAGEIFRDRLELNETTGSLTISNITPAHAGLYKLRIISSSRGTLCKKFRVFIPFKFVLMTAGESVRLSTDRPKIERDDEIQWMFGDENILIAEIRGGTREIYDGPDGIFRDRLELNDQTGDLTILNSTAERAGLYNLKIRSSKGNTNRTYIVTTDKARKKLLMKEKYVNKSASEVMRSLLDK